jgi:hypothetical protein
MNRFRSGSRQTNDQPSNCNVSMRFNFTIGAIALLAAVLIGYFLFGR